MRAISFGYDVQGNFTIRKSNVFYKTLEDILFVFTEISKLAKTIGANDIADICDSVNFEYIKMGTKIEINDGFSFGKEKCPYDIIRVCVPICDIYYKIREVPKQYGVNSITTSLMGLMQTTLIGLESSDFDCSESYIYLTME